MSGAAFCDNCGGSLAAAAPPPVQQPYVPPPQQPYAPPPVQPPPQPIPVPAYPPPTPPVSAPPAVSPRLVIQSTGASVPFPPGKAEIMIGREDPVSGSFPDVDLGRHGGDEGGVSRRHAKIIIRGAQCFIEDLKAVNYTVVNKQRLDPSAPHELKNGDEVCFGRVIANFYTN